MPITTKRYKLPLKMYEYDSQLGTETFIRYIDIYVFGEKMNPASETAQYSMYDARNLINLPELTQFYYRAYESTHELDDSGYLVAINDWIGKSYRFRFVGDEGRFIETSFSGSEPFYNFGSFKFYYSGAQKYSMNTPTGSTSIIASYTDADNSQSDSISMPFMIVTADNKMYWQWSSCETRHYNGNYIYQASILVSNEITGTDKNQLLEWLDGFIPLQPDDENPYYNGGTSEPSLDRGNFSDASDELELDDLPSLSAVDTGFATLFTPSKFQLARLADIMWGNNVFAALQNLVENIDDMFTSLGIVPFNVRAGSTVEVTWFGLPITEVTLTLAAQQYYEFDMGSIDLANDNRIFTSGSALDYSPFSKLGIFLPFIGFQELDIDECRKHTLGLKYRIDILSGTCVAIISVQGNPIYQFTGNCLTQIPITSQNMDSVVSNAVQVGIAISNAAVSAASAGGDIAAAAETSKGVQTTDITRAVEHVAAKSGNLMSASANAMMGMKPNFKKSGAVSAAASLLTMRQPYLFLTTPNQSLPDKYQRYHGFPCNMTRKLGDLSGYTVVDSIRLNDLVATSPEVAEIYDLLTKGVII